MQYVRLGSSGLNVSRICLGCMSFGEPNINSRQGSWSLNEDASRPFIRYALESGINFFDTANVYGKGSSEEILGRALHDFGNRDEIVLATKLYFPMRGGKNNIGLSRKSIMTEVDASLQRLGTDYIDLYQIHRWDNNTPIEETLEGLNDIIRAGKVRYVGASSMFAWQFSKSLYLAELKGWTKFVSMQNHYNLLNREEEREMIPLCVDQGIGMIPWSPLARGRLTRDWDMTTERGKADERVTSLYDGENGDREIVLRVTKVAKELGKTRAQIALAWMLSKPYVTAPIIGATQLYHLEDAVATVELEFSDTFVSMLEEPYTPHRLVGF